MSKKKNLTEEEIEAKVEEFALWIKEQQNLPQNLGRSETFLDHSCLFWLFWLELL
jgi:hypothetical protein